MAFASQETKVVRPRMAMGLSEERLPQPSELQRKDEANRRAQCTVMSLVENESLWDLDEEEAVDFSFGHFIPFKNLLSQGLHYSAFCNFKI